MIASGVSEDWERVAACPACLSTSAMRAGNLDGEAYQFGTEEIPYPPGGVGIRICSECTLVYKEMVPTRDYLIAAFQRNAGTVWADSYTFREEQRLIRRLAGADSFHLLDIGPSDGSLLGACARWGGRRAGLDVMMHPGLEQHLRGEFIQAALDDPVLDWSEQPFDVISALDVLEHLKDPRAAFGHLADLATSSGVVMLETGDAESLWPRRFGLPAWSYLRLFEHYIAWTETALGRIADEHGFFMESVTRKRHKSHKQLTLTQWLKAFAKAGAYRISPRGYVAVAGALRARPAQPRSPLALDHLHAVLRRR